MIELHPDFKDFLRLCESHGVSCLIVGGYAVGFHGYPRATGDLDIFVDRSADNANRLVEVLREFGFGNEATASLFLEPESVVRIGLPPVRLEVFSGISGVTFEQCARNAVSTNIDGISVRFIGRQELLLNKLASGRPKDLVDHAALSQGDSTSP